MTKVNFHDFVSLNKSIVESELEKYIDNLTAPEQLKKSMIYSLSAGGKRIRPLLVFATLHAFQIDIRNGIQAACAIEMLHTYSLIHDDLPAMDNDDLRRGKPTNHREFDEATAILAGDALLTMSFELLSDIPETVASDRQKIELIKGLSKAAGANGMVGGQVLDMLGEGKKLTIRELEQIHRNKTGELLAYSVLAGAILSDATERQKKKLLEFAHYIGLAFQIRDDILDIEGSENLIGKPVGSDLVNEKNTYVSILSLHEAKVILKYTIEKALNILDALNIRDEYLREVCYYIQNRNS